MVGVDCFADDSGLEFDALNGAPGVDAAHYAGPQRNDRENYQRVLKELAGVTSNRKLPPVMSASIVANEFPESTVPYSVMYTEVPLWITMTQVE